MFFGRPVRRRTLSLQLEVAPARFQRRLLQRKPDAFGDLVDKIEVFVKLERPPQTYRDHFQVVDNRGKNRCLVVVDDLPKDLSADLAYGLRIGAGQKKRLRELPRPR